MPCFHELYLYFNTILAILRKKKCLEIERIRERVDIERSLKAITNFIFL